MYGTAISKRKLRAYYNGCDKNNGELRNSNVNA